MKNAVEFAKENGLYVKMVVSTSAFDTYNSFFNIYGETEEPCRRVAVITPYRDLEEVIEVDVSNSIITDELIDNNLWLKEYPLTTIPSTVNLDELTLNSKQIELLKRTVIKN